MRRARSALIRLLLSLIVTAWACAAAAQPVALVDVRLQDQRGQVVMPASFKGRALLLNFVFTGCSTTCPTQMRELVLLQRGLPDDVKGGLQLLSVTVDPAHDTPQTLAAFARLHDATTPAWRFATGAPAQVDTLMARMAAIDTRNSSRRPEDHRTSLWLFDGAGTLVQRYAGVPVDRARLSEEITQLVRYKK